MNVKIFGSGSRWFFKAWVMDDKGRQIVRFRSHNCLTKSQANSRMIEWIEFSSKNEGILGQVELVK